MSKELADLIFSNITKEADYYEKLYPERNLKEGAIVTRFAPSPTGFVHLGSLFASMVERKMAKQTGGVFFLRIEDTDGKREVENGVEGIVNSLKEFGITIDEGQLDAEKELGNYGPYKQSNRKEIYHFYAKYLLEKGLAYPCFCKEEELNRIREIQEKQGVIPGYYGGFAKCRNLSFEEIKQKIENGETYILRLKSPGNYERKIKVHDLIKGNIEFPENNQDIVIIKSDGLPTYHFAHAVDDHLMRTTHVIRGDEWLASVPLHVQLFKCLDFKAPKYAHIAPIMKEEDGSKRKLSKRKDVEAAVGYYSEQGIPVQAVMEYLMNIANANFEMWRKANSDKSIEDFTMELSKMSVSGALFDMVKLLNVSKEVISKLNKDEVYENVYNWANIYDKDLKELMDNNVEFTKQVLGIERGNVVKPRKDISKWSDIKEATEYMYDDLFFAKEREYIFQTINDKQEIKNMLLKYIEKYFELENDKQTWFNKIKDLAEEFGYAKEVKEYKVNPENYKGHVGDVSTMIRVALTNRTNTPDMYEIMQVLGKESVIKRLNEI